MQNGFLYLLFDTLLACFNKVNLVEFFKFVAKKLTKEPNKEIENQNIAIDIFIVSKWLLIIILWINRVDGLFFKIFTGYLIITNLHTYFYYHVWHIRAVTNEQVSPNRMKRRFMNLLLAIAFSILAYSYLYQVCYADHFTGWQPSFNLILSAIYFSLANSIKGSGSLTPLTDTGLFIMASQFVSTYVFLAIMLSRSVPQFNQK